MIRPLTNASTEPAAISNAVNVLEPPYLYIVLPSKYTLIHNSNLFFHEANTDHIFSMIDHGCIDLTCFILSWIIFQFYQAHSIFLVSKNKNKKKHIAYT